ncbi:hypothetical protein MKX01_006744 [Papaver californicum]|nr:hypothetical protein MKX01_006744 [Papaver californicum]
MNPTTALILDDCQVMRMFHSINSYHLRALGFQTREAENGQAAVQLLETGMRFDATRRIREMGIQSVILGVSAISDEDVRANFVQLGLTELFEKPLVRDMLIPYLTSV